MTNAGWMMFAAALIAAVSTCVRPQGSVTASTGTEAYGSSAAPGAFDALTDVYQTGRASARQNF
jgi:hypothetical protein